MYMKRIMSLTLALLALTAPTYADRLIHQGRSVEGISVDGEQTYVLEEGRYIYRFDRNGSRERIGNQSGTTKIVADNGHVYRLTRYGVDYYEGGWTNSWRALDSSGRIRDIDAHQNEVFMQTDRNLVFRVWNNGANETWDDSGNANRIKADANGNCFVSYRHNNGIYMIYGINQYAHYDGRATETADFDGDNNGGIMLLRVNGKIYNTYQPIDRDPNAWRSIYEGGDATSIVPSTSGVYGTTRNGTAVKFDNGYATPVFNRGQVSQIDARNGGVAVRTGYGEVYRLGGGVWDSEGTGDKVEKFQQLHAEQQ